MIDRREDGEIVSEATVKVHGRRQPGHRDQGGQRARATRSTARCARRSSEAYPRLRELELTDYKVRILPGNGHGCGHPRAGGDH